MGNTGKMAGSMIKLSGVWKIYQMGEVQVPALKGVDVDIKRGEFVAIIGASGSGKSTMMNLVGCLDVPTKGKIHLKGNDITELEESDLASLRGKTIGFVFQQYNLIPNMTAFQNVMLPMELQEKDERKAKEQAKKMLEMVGLGELMNNLPSQLSGGQQQRVSIARSLSMDPDIILADEPTGALDSITGKAILDMLGRLWKEEGKTIIMVTHDIHLAQYAKRIIELKDGKVIDDRRLK
jgi:putative ABC transport system ATP-binding protein